MMFPRIYCSIIGLIELQEALRVFFQEQSQIAADEKSQLAVEPLIKGQIEIKTLLDQWLKFVEVIFEMFEKP
jgi:hypothetical protein